MTAKSFYDLDYIIELNERRLAQNMAEYDRALGRFTNILVVYSGVTIFLIPTIQDTLVHKVSAALFYIAFIAFGLLLLSSLYFTIRLLLPVELAYLVSPQTYYSEYRQQYETERAGASDAQTDTEEKARTAINTLIKASYIGELETAVNAYDKAVRQKRSHYANALRWSLLSILPYLVCLVFHFSIRDEAIHKVQIVTPAAGVKAVKQVP